jgi:uncharacterized protein
MDLRAKTRAALAEGRRLFDAGRFFEAHEVWEAAWLSEEGDTRELLQGLIQIAAGYHQAFDRGHARGCARLLEAGASRLAALEGFDALAAEREGLALRPFRDAVGRDLARARSWERGESGPLSREEAPHLGVSKE